MTREENAAYSRGYAAGKRRRLRDIQSERLRDKERAFLERAFLALLPTAMQVENWTLGKEKISTGAQRVKLARIWAQKANSERYLL